MNQEMTESEAQSTMEALNVIYRAANAAMPSGLVPEAAKVQAEAINDAAQKVAEFIQKVVAPTVSSNIGTITDEPVADVKVVPEPSVVAKK